MLVASDFREKARESLSGKWALAVGTGFVASLLGAYTALGSSSGGSSSSSSSEALDTLSESGVPEEIVLSIAMILLTILMIAFTIALVRLILSGPASLGYARFNLNLVDNNNAQFSDLFSGFKNFGKGLAMQLLRWLFIFLWALLLIIPGIIATYRYAMAPYIICENPDMSASEAIEESKRLMDGNKWRLFCLEISFIGWDILCIFTLGIGYLWLKPYREAA